MAPQLKRTRLSVLVSGDTMEKSARRLSAQALDECFTRPQIQVFAATVVENVTTTTVLRMVVTLKRGSARNAITNIMVMEPK